MASWRQGEWCTPKFLDGFNYESKGEDIKRRRSWGVLPSSQHFEGKRGVLELQDGTRQIDKQFTYSHEPAQNQTSWLVCSWSTLVHKRTMGNHGLTTFTTARTWGKPPPSPLNYPLCLAIGPAPKCHLSRDSQVGVSKFPKLGFPQFWGLITLCEDLQLRWDLKQSRSPCQELFNNMLHATCMQGNRGDSWLLVVGSQITNLIPDPSFGHNLCLKCPNGSCEPIRHLRSKSFPMI